MIATYLINPDSGQKKEELFLSYGVSFESDRTIAEQICSYIIDLRKTVEDELKKNDEVKLFKEVEMPLSRILANMEIEGFPIDLPTLKEIDAEYQGILKSLQDKIYSLAGKEFNINSPKQLDQILFTDLGIQRNKGE